MSADYAGAVVRQDGQEFKVVYDGNLWADGHEGLSSYQGSSQLSGLGPLSLGNAPLNRLIGPRQARHPGQDLIGQILILLTFRPRAGRKLCSPINRQPGVVSKVLMNLQQQGRIACDNPEDREHGWALRVTWRVDRQKTTA